MESAEEHEALQESWAAFVEDGKIAKCAPGRPTLGWVQRKYLQLGASKVVATMLSHDSNIVKHLALRFGIACLENRCTPMQAECPQHAL